MNEERLSIGTILFMPLCMMIAYIHSLLFGSGELYQGIYLYSSIMWLFYLYFVVNSGDAGKQEIAFVGCWLLLIGIVYVLGVFGTNTFIECTCLDLGLTKSISMIGR